MTRSALMRGTFCEVSERLEYRGRCRRERGSRLSGTGGWRMTGSALMRCMFRVRPLGWNIRGGLEREGLAIRPGARLADDGKRSCAEPFRVRPSRLEIGGGLEGEGLNIFAGAEAGGFLLRIFERAWRRVAVVFLSVFSKSRQDAPKMPPRRPKTPSRRAKTPPRRPETPRGPQGNFFSILLLHKLTVGACWCES